jgi:hypothetical protein
MLDSPKFWDYALVVLLSLAMVAVAIEIIR